jgi:hypothetical protein
MKLKQLGSNQTELVLNDGTQVLFSYETPVACWIEGQFYRTDKKWSQTTSRHINKWAHCALNKPQSFFDALVLGADKS